MEKLIHLLGAIGYVILVLSVFRYANTRDDATLRHRDYLMMETEMMFLTRGHRTPQTVMKQFVKFIDNYNHDQYNARIGAKHVRSFHHYP